MTGTVEPFSNSVQVGLRVPVILIALVGMVLALALIRRLGAAAGILGALGGLLIAADQVVNIVWLLHLTSVAESDDYEAYIRLGNAYNVADAVLITIGVAVLVGAVVAAALKKPATAQPQQPFPYQQQPFPQQPFPPQHQVPPFNAQ